MLLSLSKAVAKRHFFCQNNKILMHIPKNDPIFTREPFKMIALLHAKKEKRVCYF